MKFTYFYKTSDGVRHEGELAAPSREDAFAELRKQGIKAIKVVSQSGSKANGEEKFVGKRFIFAALVLGLVAGGIAAYCMSRKAPTQFYRADGTVGKARSDKAVVPMVRRQIFGDRKLIRELVTEKAHTIFTRSSEAFLLHYALPGWQFDAPVKCPDDFESDVMQALEEPIYYFEGERNETIELKRIVAGIKEELRMFLASGGTVAEFVKRLEQRQNTESAARKTAIDELNALLAENKVDEAIRHWQQANDDLGTMGIERIPKPSQFGK